MRRLFILCLLLYSIVASGQEKPQKPTFEFYGFIRFESFFDSYKGINAANEQFYVVPLFAGIDANGKHINETPTYNFSNMATRLGLRIAGPEMLNAKTSANIEADFAGDLGSNPAMFRIRQAHALFVWPKTSLLVGQTWHPFWTGKAMPTVSSLNTGNPFQPFNRSPQIKFEYRPNATATMSVAVVSEFQYKSYGFSKIETMTTEKSDIFNRNAGIPELTANIDLSIGSLSLGAGASMKHIKPTLYTVGSNGLKYVSNEQVQSFSMVGYGQYSKKMFTIRAKAILGQNTAYLLIPGGYGVKSFNKTTGEMSYTPYSTFTGFVNAVYGTKFQVGIFGGYLKNLGTIDNLYNFGTSTSPSVVALGMIPNITSIYRISPHISFNINKLRISTEYELTTAKTGIGEIKTSDGLYSKNINLTNHRAQLLLMYSF